MCQPTLLPDVLRVECAASSLAAASPAVLSLLRRLGQQVGARLRRALALGRAVDPLPADCLALAELDAHTLRDLGIAQDRHWSAAADPAAIRARLASSRCGVPF